MKRKYMVWLLAAMLCVLLFSIYVCVRGLWIPIYNEHTHALHGNYPEFWESQRDMTPDEIAGILPAELLRTVESTGKVYFLEDGSVSSAAVCLEWQEEKVFIYLGEKLVDMHVCCMWDTRKDKMSPCGSTSYNLQTFMTNHPKTPERYYFATGTLNGIPVLVRIKPESSLLGKCYFEKLLYQLSKEKDLSISHFAAS